MLDMLGLSPANRRIAETYLDTESPEDAELLAKLERQDFSKLEKEKRRKCVEYLEHVRKRGQTDEEGRYVKLAAAVGGSTAYYVLFSYRWDAGQLQNFLTREQIAAIRIESIVWNVHSLQRVGQNFEEKDPEILFKAMELCYEDNINAKMLLAATGLYYTKADKPSGGIFGGKLFKKETAKNVREAVTFLEDSLVSNIPELFQAAAPSAGDLERLQSFVRGGAEDKETLRQLPHILQGKQTSDYLTVLFAGTAFLAIEHSAQFAAFLLLAVAMDAEENRTDVLNMCWTIGKQGWFLRHIGALEEFFPMPKADYLRWCTEKKADDVIARIIQTDPDSIVQATRKASTKEYQYLIGRVEAVNPKLYKELSASLSGEFREKIAQELVARYMQGQAEAKRYLLGETELDTLYPYVGVWRGTNDYYIRPAEEIERLKKNSEEQQMYRRAVVLEALSLRASYFNYMDDGFRKAGKDMVVKICGIFEEEKLPAEYQMEALGAISEAFYQEREKKKFLDESVKVLCFKKEKWGSEFVRLAKDGSMLVRFLSISVLDVYSKEYKDVLLGCAADGSKQVRELLESIYISHKEWEPEVIGLLSSKKSQEREMAVLVLKGWGADAYAEALKAALASEKSKKIKELLEAALHIESSKEEAAGEAAGGELAKEIIKGGKKRKVAWVYEAPFPQVHKTDGTPASEDYLAAILVAYADMGTPGVSKEAAKLAADLKPDELAAYVGMLFGRWMDLGAEAKKKWVLYAASIHGGEPIIPVLYAQIQEWPQAARGALAAEAVKALALNGSPTALLLVDQISRKFKFRQVKAAASDALSYAAAQLGIGKEELEDRIVPNLGFDGKMEQTFDYGPRSFQVVLTPALELEVRDGDGKRLKSLPAPGKKDDPEKAGAASEAFKLLKKQLKTVVANQKLRLDQALSAERTWQAGKWKELFVKNPVMHQFAIGLIWGLYEDGALTATFRYMEDGSFNTADEEEYELPETGRIGLVHPIELDEESLAAWKEQLSDYEVTQPIEQLERPVYRLTEQEGEQDELTRFGGKLLNGLSLSGKLQSMGWYWGSVGDGGGFYTFYREDGETGTELEFSGCFVGDENEEITVYGAVFYKAGTVKRGSYVYDEVKKENRYKLSEVNPRYFSEIVLQLTKATASSKEQLAYPACKK